MDRIACIYEQNCKMLNATASSKFPFLATKYIFLVQLFVLLGQHILEKTSKLLILEREHVFGVNSNLKIIAMFEHALCIVAMKLVIKSAIKTTLDNMFFNDTMFL